MALVGVVHIQLYGRNIPMSEDWNLVRPLTGQEPSFWSWVWSQNNEHRLPVARLIHLGLLEVTGDFRSGAVFDTVLMAAVAAGLVLLARRLRGRTSLLDAVFPIVLLHPGNWENLFWSWQMQFVVVAAMTLGLLVVLAGGPSPPTTRSTLVAAGLLVLLPLGGGTALALVPAAIAAVLVLVFDSGTSVVARRVAVGASVLCVAEVGAYFVGWSAATWYPDNPGPSETLLTGGKLLALGWGPAAQGRYPAAMLLTDAVVVPTTVVFLRAVRRPGPDRRRAVAFACFLGGVALTAAAVAYGRAALVPTEGLAQRYVIVTMPALLGAWFAVQHFGTGGVRRFVQVTLLVGTVVLLPLNWSRGYEWRDWYVGEMEAVERDLSAGVTSEVLARRHGDFLMRWDNDELTRRLELLRREGDGPVSRLAAP